ncbi:unnamed protein product [Adineta steineri]|uniref:G-protein coupled receptors family 1 profile domain-containing protein n=1 Tax=Adineta steineri TaxID=433720 RepID=A0A819VAA6_9BILA|nr:unnamed protein product [Adineta steineri]
MSSAATLYNVQQQILRIGGPLLIVIGTISCLMNLMVFTKNTLRKNPCTICFIAVNIINLLYFYFGLLPTILSSGYNIDPSTNNIVLCRLRLYFAYVFSSWQSSYIILAAIDRTFITSPNANTRRFSTRRLIIISMIRVSVFWLLFMSHGLIFSQIIQFAPGYFVCYCQPGLYSILIAYQSISILGVIPPLVMTIFGFLTVRNIRGIQRPAQHSRAVDTGVIAVGQLHALHSKDQQLIRMLLVDIISFTLCKFPSEIMTIYSQITQYNVKSVEQQIIEQSVLQLTFLWYFVDNGISCYTNVLVSKTFRAELKRIFSNAYAFYFH